MSGALVTFATHVELARREGRSLGAYAIAVGFAIVTRLGADPAAGCWPSIRTIAADAGCSPRRASDAIKELLGAGVLLKRSGAGARNTNTYRLRPLGPVCVARDPEHTEAAVERQRRSRGGHAHPLQGEFDFGLTAQPGGLGSARGAAPSAPGAESRPFAAARDAAPSAPRAEEPEGLDRRGVGARGDFETGFEEEASPDHPPGTLIERVKAAVLDAGGSLGAFWDGPAARNEIDRWRALGLTPEQIVDQVLAEQRRVGSTEAGGPRAFTRAMLRLAGQLAAPAYQPAQNPSWQPRVVRGGGRRSRHDDEDLNPGTNHLGRWYAGPPC